MWLVGTATVAGSLPVRLRPGESIVGRAKGVQIVITDATVSRHHARLVVARSEISVEDLHSSNGTFINERPVTQSILRLGDHVRFGGVTCGISDSPLLFHQCDETTKTHRLLRDAGPILRIDHMTVAQREIVVHVLDGRNEAEIAKLLGKSRHTIHTHLKTIFRELGVHSRAELIVKLLKAG